MKALGFRELRVRHLGELGRLELGAAELAGLRATRRGARPRCARSAPPATRAPSSTSGRFARARSNEAALVNVRLAYGTTGLDVELPDERTTVRAADPPRRRARDERAALRAALAAPVARPAAARARAPRPDASRSRCATARARSRAS